MGQGEKQGRRGKIPVELQDRVAKTVKKKRVTTKRRRDGREKKQ